MVYLPFSSLLNNQATSSDEKRIFHALQWARSEAIKRNTTITICGSSDFHHCQTNWRQGFIVFIDHKKGPTHVLYSDKNSGLTDIHSGQLKSFKFYGDGRCLTRGTIYLNTPKSVSRIVINDSGRIKIDSSSKK